MSLALGTIARLRTRGMYSLMNSKSSLKKRLHVSDEVREELEFWEACIQGLNSQNLWKALSTVRVVLTDASVTGVAGYTVEHGCHIAHGQWKEDERAKSSTWREMAAVD